MARQLRLVFALPIAVFAFWVMPTIHVLSLQNSKSCPQWEPLMKKHGLPVEIFSALAYRESRCIPNAVGWNYLAGKSYKDCRLSVFSSYKNCKAVKTFDSGLWQINSSWYTLVKQICKGTPQNGVLFDPECNARVAKYLYRDGKGLSNWGYRSSR